MKSLLWRHGSAGAHQKKWGTGNSSLGRPPLLYALEVVINPTIEPLDPRGCQLRPQTTRERVQPHPSADNWIKVLLSKALPTRARPSSSQNQSFPSGNLHRPVSLLHQRADRSMKNCSPTELKQKPRYRKLIRMKKQKVISQRKGQDKPSEQVNEVEIGKSRKHRESQA